MNRGSANQLINNMVLAPIGVALSNVRLFLVFVWPTQSALKSSSPMAWSAAHSLAPILLVLESVQHIVRYFQLFNNSFTHYQLFGLKWNQTVFDRTHGVLLK